MKNLKQKFKSLKKGQLILGIILMLGCVSAVWVMLGWTGSSTANVIGQTPTPMIVISDLTDFGILDFSSGDLNRSKQFNIESPNGGTETFYMVTWNATKTELNQSCVYTEDEIVFRLFKTTGARFIGELEQEQVLSLISNGDPTFYELRIIAISKNVCPADYLVDVVFEPSSYGAFMNQ